MIKLLKKYWEEKPLTLIVFVAALLRLVAAIFSKGFGWHDDHFLVIEAAQSWVDGTDYNRWLPSFENQTPSGHSFFYPGLHFLILSFLKWIGMTEPQSKMLVIRLLHAAFSMIIVVTGYRITEKLSNRNAARIAGILLAAYWFMPFLSVRNLVEFVTIPFLMISAWIIIRNERSKYLFRTFFIAGIFAGIATCVRFQSVIFISGIGLALLLQGKWKQVIYYAFGTLLFFGLFQGINDYLVWGRPFAEFFGYIKNNVDDAHKYIANTWYSYLVLIMGLLLPPVSLYILFGFFRSWRKHLLLFLPSFLFLLFHSFFPNKQERFILTIVPFVIIVGVAGWNEFLSTSSFWQRRKKLLRGSYTFVIVLNCLLLPFITTMYSKQARVESMVYLSKDTSIRFLAFENTNHSRLRMAPQFYLNKWIYVEEITNEHPPEEFAARHTSPEDWPDYILFFEDVNLEHRVATLQKYYPHLHYVTTIGQNFIDALLHKMNPNNNVNQTVYIYKVK